MSPRHAPAIQRELNFANIKIFLLLFFLTLERIIFDRERNRDEVRYRTNSENDR